MAGLNHNLALYMSSRIDILQDQPDDGFMRLEVEPWQQQKQQLVQHYLKANYNRLDLRNKNKIFLDIGCGPGLLNVRNSQSTLVGSPLLALGMEEQFNRYIFCDKETSYTSALKVRVNKFFPKENVLILDGDINELIEVLPRYLPHEQGKVANSLLALIDTFSFDVHFETVKWLSELGVDLLFVNAFPHTEHHTYKFYLNEERELLNDFFGTAWAPVAELNEIQNDASFFMLAVKGYAQQLKSLGYKVATSLHQYTPSVGKAPYFQIAYCTKSKLFQTVQKSAALSTNQQINLFQKK